VCAPSDFSKRGNVHHKKGECRGGIPLCRGYGGVPQTFLGREGGKNSVHVAARTPTPPITHNASPTTPLNEAQTAKGGIGGAGTPDLNETILKIEDLHARYFSS